MEVCGTWLAGFLFVLAVTGTSASNGMARLIEDHLLPYYCDIHDYASCRKELPDPQGLLIDVIYRQLGLSFYLSLKAILPDWSPITTKCNQMTTLDILCTQIQRASQVPPKQTQRGLNVTFNPSAFFGPPFPFLCEWGTESNEVANWEPGSGIWNLLTREEGPIYGAYAISRLNSLTTAGTTGLLTPVIHGQIDITTPLVALLNVDYYIRGKPHNCILSIKLFKEDGERFLIWSTEDDFPENEGWNNLRFLEFQPSLPFQLVFESTMTPGEAVKPYVAVDNIILHSGALPSKYDCEQGALLEDDCGLIEFSSDDFWSSGSGSTPTADTGPSVDHTLGNENGHYVFLSASKMAVTSVAMLQSLGYYKWRQSSCTLRFYYHAFGVDLGSLKVLINSTESSTEHHIALTSRDQWTVYDIDLTGVSGRYRIIFVATAAGAKGEIALDDMEFLHDECLGKDLCQSFPCRNGGTCSQTKQDGFYCDCTEGYEGPDCSINIDECSLDPSLCDSDPLRVCQNTSPGYKCVCQTGYMEFKGKCIEACSNNPCTREDGVCLQNDNGFTCKCKYGYIESADGDCVRDKSDVKSGIAPYTQKVLIGTYVGGFLLGIFVAVSVIFCYFSFCDEHGDENDINQDNMDASPGDYDVPGTSRLNTSNKASRNDGFEMEGLNSKAQETYKDKNTTL